MRQLLLIQILVATCIWLSLSTAWPLPFPDNATALEDAYLDSHPNNFTVGGLDRRWYGVKSEDELTVQEREQYARSREYGIWPPITLLPGHPWYPDGITRHYIQFCFADDDTAKELVTVMAAAIARWWPAFEHSSLMIMPDITCYNPKAQETDEKLYMHCVCGEQPNGKHTGSATLHIGRQAPGVPRSEATLGFDYTSSEPGRHFIKILRLIPPDSYYEADVHIDAFNLQVNDMTHELGHAIGLLHEHERPDRDHFLEVDCTGLRGYKRAERAALDLANAGDWKNEPTIDQRMKRICSEEKMQKKYLPGAYTLFKKFEYPEWRDYDGWVEDKEFFDYGSIMIYSPSIWGHSLFKLPLSRKFPPGYKPGLYGTAEGVYGFIDGNFHPGGALGNRDKRISTMDVKRVAMLYPGIPARLAKAKALSPKQQWEPVHTDDMIDNPAWGHQIRAGAGPLWIAPTVPDVVDRRLTPVVNPKRRWVNLYGFYKPPTFKEEVIGAAKKMVRAEDWETIYKEISRFVQKFNIKPDPKPQEKPSSDGPRPGSQDSSDDDRSTASQRSSRIAAQAEQAARAWRDEVAVAMELVEYSGGAGKSDGSSRHAGSNHGSGPTRGGSSNRGSGPSRPASLVEAD